ncbi:MAG: hypothetical protein PVS2B2_05810 [Candidatus Acidiferrum sp.]
MTAQDYKAPPSVGRLQRGALAIGVIGLALGALGWFRTPEQFYRSYLPAFLLVLGLTMGSQGLLMLQHLTGGNWGIMIRRPLEAATRTLWLVVVLFVPILIGMGSLYREWLSPERLKAAPLSPFQQTYLTYNWFIVRAAIYFIVWIALVVIFNALSAQQDVNREDRALRRRLKMLAGPGIILYVIAMTFAVIDWVMSISPHWASTIYGFLFVAGQLILAMSLMIATIVLLARSEPYDHVLQKRHLHDLGKLLLAFIMLWAYFDFSQLLITWSGNQPEEITFYKTRLYGGWGVVAVVVLLFHFALPFFLLLSRDLKRNSRFLLRLTVWMIFARFVDLYWMTRPEFTGSAMPHWLDFAVPTGLLGVWVAFFAMNLQQRPLLPLGEPKLEEAIANHEH